MYGLRWVIGLLIAGAVYGSNKPSYMQMRASGNQGQALAKKVLGNQFAVPLSLQEFGLPDTVEAEPRMREDASPSAQLREKIKILDSLWREQSTDMYARSSLLKSELELLAQLGQEEQSSLKPTIDMQGLERELGQALAIIEQEKYEREQLQQAGQEDLQRYQTKVQELELERQEEQRRAQEHKQELELLQKEAQAHKKTAGKLLQEKEQLKTTHEQMIERAKQDQERLRQQMPIVRQQEVQKSELIKPIVAETESATIPAFDKESIGSKGPVRDLELQPAQNLMQESIDEDLFADLMQESQEVRKKQSKQEHKAAEASDSDMVYFADEQELPEELMGKSNPLLVAARKRRQKISATQKRRKIEAAVAHQAEAQSFLPGVDNSASDQLRHELEQVKQQFAQEKSALASAHEQELAQQRSAYAQLQEQISQSKNQAPTKSVQPTMLGQQPSTTQPALKPKDDKATFAGKLAIARRMLAARKQAPKAVANKFPAQTAPKIDLPKITLPNQGNKSRSSVPLLYPE